MNSSYILRMKFKYYLLIFILLFARGCDFYSTSLWFFDNPTGEQNLLYRIFGFGWSALLVSNAIIVALIIYCYYYYCFKYQLSPPTEKSYSITDYVSLKYFKKKGLFHQVFYKLPFDKKTGIGHFGYVMIRVAIVGSFLATFHNFCQFYNIDAYNSFRELVGRPLWVIYGLILASFIFFQYRLWKKEFELSRQLYEKAVAAENELVTRD